MSRENIHNDILSQLDPIIVAAALERVSGFSSTKLQVPQSELQSPDMSSRPLQRSKSTSSLREFNQHFDSKSAIFQIGDDAEVTDVDVESLSYSQDTSGFLRNGLYRKKQPNPMQSLLPYVSSALDLAEQKFGDRASLRKVSVVRRNKSVDDEMLSDDPDSAAPKLKTSNKVGKFLRKKKPEKRDSEASIIFSFKNQQQESFNSHLTVPKISVTHDFITTADDEDENAMVTTYSQTTMNSELESKASQPNRLLN